MSAQATPDRVLSDARALTERGEWQAVAALGESTSAQALLHEPELGYAVAYARRRIGETASALELTQALAASCDRRGHDRLWRRRLNLEGMLLWDLGDMDGAETAWEGVVEVSAAAADDSTLAIAHNNLGVVSTLQGRHDEALTHYERALLAYVRLGERRGAAETHTNLGIAYREKDFPREAESHFGEAIHIACEIDSGDVCGRAETERAMLLVEAGDPRLAEATARRALGRFEALGDAAGAGDAHRALGIAAMVAGRLDDARRQLDEALARAESTGAALLRAETLEAMSVLARLEDDSEGSRIARERSVALFEQMRAYQWGERVRHRLARLVGIASTPELDA